ncbi:mitogen activated protein kinase [Rhypophila sp. PSN 637]
MEDELSPHVRDYQIETRFPKKRVVEHVYDDGNTLPECWKSEKRPLGSGGQGTVYLQTCTSGSRRYTQRAVKVIPLQERNVKRYYLRELQIVVRFSHDRYSRYFVKSLGWYLSGNTLCIAMEYLAKGDLEMYLRSKPPLLEIECRQIIAQVTKALALMHKEGYTHRDIKPQNVLIQEHPVDDGLSIWWVKLTDFGISKPLETATSGASTTTGTLLYMAPERLGWGNNTNISYPAADIWALGVMSYRLLAGTDLFPTVGKIFQYCGHPELGVLDNHKISTDGAAFIHALLRPQASLRLESAAALVHDWIRPYTTSSAQAAVVPDLHSESSSEPSRNSSFDEERGWTTILSNATDLRNHLPIDPRAQPALSPIRRASTTSKNVDKAGVTAMAVVEMRGSADASVDEGQSHAATSKGHLATLQTLPINNKTISNTTATWQLQQTLPGHNNMVWSVAFSPDSKLLASGSYGGTIRIWNTATWQLQQTLPGHNDVVHSVAFSPDSKFLASGSHDGTIRLWNTATWQLQQTLPDHDDIVHSVAFSPDSKLLASSSWDMTIRLWDIATNTPKSQ